MVFLWGLGFERSDKKSEKLKGVVPKFSFYGFRGDCEERVGVVRGARLVILDI